jgi:hypothetical protein
MSEVVSFGNIVNSLRAVRNDYNEHLKAVPQYEAFLLVESSTQSVADKLQGVAPVMAAEVVEALETAKAKFRQHLTSVPEYRALLAIDQLINHVAADLGVHAIAPAVIETQTETAADAATSPGQVEQPVADEQAVVYAEAAELPQGNVLNHEAAEDIVSSLHVIAEAEAQQAHTQEPALTTADALSQLQEALQTGDQTSPSTAEADAVAEVASSAPLHAEELSHEAEKAA